MAKMTFNTDPYFDDFDETKNFHQILYKPKFPIQTREVNQTQSILKNQIERFGDHIFKHGSVVSDSIPNYDNGMNYVRLKDLDTNNLPVQTDLMVGKKIVGKTTGVSATCQLFTIITEHDPATIYVNYLTSSEDGLEKVFKDGEELVVYDDQNNSIYSCYVRCPTCIGSTEPATETIPPTGKCAIFTVTEGIYYIFGSFVYTPTQTIILAKYTTTPNLEVGFNIVQTVVTEHDDLSLLDNSLGYPNYTSPGADRYKIQLNLEKSPTGSNPQDNWVLLARIEWGVLKEIKDKPQYADIMDMMARRTYDESGDYTVRSFLINFTNFLKSTPNSTDGIFYADESVPNEDLEKYKDQFVSVMSPGKAYVRGYEIERLASSNLIMDRARDEGTIENTAIRYTQGNYIYVATNPQSNTYPLNDTATEKYAVDFEDISFYADDNPWTNGTPTSPAIGTAKVKSQLNTGKTIKDSTGVTDVPVFKLYLFEMVINDGYTFVDVMSSYKTGINTFATKVLTDDEWTEIDAGVGNGSGLTDPLIYDPNDNMLITKTKESWTSGINNVTMTTRKKFTGQASAGGDFVFSTGNGELFESFNSDKWIFSELTGANYIYKVVDSSQVTISDQGTNQQATVTGFGSNQECCVICDVITSSVPSKTKNLRTENNYTVTLNGSNYQDWQSLQKIDGRRILSIIDITDPNPENQPNVINDFDFDDGLRDNTYSMCRIRRNLDSQPDYNGSNNAQYNVNFEYFEHLNTNNGYMFTASSYQTMIDDPNQDFDYEDIPVYTSQSGDDYELRRCFDFRVDEEDDGQGGEFTDTGYMPSHDSNIIHDVTFYLPRIDKIVIDSKTSQFVVVRGIPAINPLEPKTPKNTMAIYTVNLAPYTLDVKKDVFKKYVNNRRFTMRDIGKIEKRVDNLEYYVTFTMLEKDAESTSIKDANGLDRFKNGLITDNFNTFIASDTKHPEFKASIDVKKSEMGPAFKTRKVELALDTDKSSNYQISGDIITQPYTEFIFQTQKMASKTISVNPYFIFNWEGVVELIPKYDSWKDVDRQPDLIVDLDSGLQDGKDLEDGQLNETLFGNWENVENNVADVDVDGVISTKIVGEKYGDIELTNESGTRANDGSTKRASSIIVDITTQKSLGDRITDVELLAFAREQDIQFVATSMRPNTVIYPYFDDVPIAQFCRPLNGSNGDQLKTSNDGQFIGVFSLPNTDEVSFHTGDRIFRLTDSKDDSQDEDEVTATASTVFWSGGLKTEVREVKVTQTEYGVEQAACVWNGVVYNEGDQLETFIHDERHPGGNTIKVETSPFSDDRQWGGKCENSSWVQVDPIAQSFSVEVEQNGCFITKMNVFFSAKSEDASLWLEVREMDNGYPAPAILPYSRVVKQPSSIELSDDASVGTTFVFDAPVYLQGNTDYCFVIGSTDLAYRVHVAKLGDISTNGAMITSQPSMGSLFKSQNNKTWNAEQSEDIKFNMYKANFGIEPMKLHFVNNGYDADNLPYNPIETQFDSNIVRIHHRNHGFVIGDKFSLDLLTKTEFQVVILSGNLIIGQILTNDPNPASTGECTVTSATFIEDTTTPSGHAGKRYNIRVKDIVGYINAGEGQSFTSNQYIEEVKSSWVLEKLDIDQNAINEHNKNLQSCVGYFEESLNGEINGIPINDFTNPVQPLNIITVDSIDSYSIEVATNATLTGLGGGDGGVVQGQIQLDMFNLSMDIKKYDCTTRGEMMGITHSGTNALFDNYNPIPEIIPFNENYTETLPQPLKIANEHNYVGNSLDIDIINETINGDTNLTPIISIPSISFTSISNRIDWNDQAHYEVAPNNDPQWDSTPQPDKARWVDEVDPLKGVESPKYVLKKVTLANPATMLRIYADVFKPNNTTVDFYYKTLPVEKSSGLENEPWIYAPYDAEFVSSTVNEFIETRITIGDEDIAQTPIPDYKEFRVKMVLRSKNSAVPPRVKNFRAIAVT